MIRVFFSWQSDIEKQKIVLQRALEKAAGAAQEIYIDTATRDEDGAIKIDDKIIEKIEQADLFVGDLSIIGQLGKKRRKSPNPNVIYETGFALGIMTEKRLYLLAQAEKTGSDKFPFDLRNRRIAFYDFENVNTEQELVEDFKRFFKKYKNQTASTSKATKILMPDNIARWHNWTSMMPSFKIGIVVDNYGNEKPNFLEKVTMHATNADGEPWQSEHFLIAGQNMDRRFKIEPHDKKDVYVLLNQEGAAGNLGKNPMPDLDRDTISIEFSFADESLLRFPVKIVNSLG